MTKYDLRLNNEYGADRIERIPHEHSDLDRDDHVLGILVDLRHYCDRWGLCFGDIDHNAQLAYESEIAGGLFKCEKKV